jgi:hypothetical protein
MVTGRWLPCTNSSEENCRLKSGLALCNTVIVKSVNAEFEYNASRTRFVSSTQPRNLTWNHDSLHRHLIRSDPLAVGPGEKGLGEKRCRYVQSTRQSIPTHLECLNRRRKQTLSRLPKKKPLCYHDSLIVFDSGRSDRNRIWSESTHTTRRGQETMKETVHDEK